MHYVALVTSVFERAAIAITCLNRFVITGADHLTQSSDTVTTEGVLTQSANETSAASPNSPRSYGVPLSIVDRLRAGELVVHNDEFDRIFPLELRIISSIQWSPVLVAKIIANTLQGRQNLRFLDIGSGVGKLCLLLGILTDMEITGVEQRRNLIKISKRIAKESALSRVHFFHRNMMDIDWGSFDVFYFYNPFQEHRYGADYARIDNAVEYDLKMFHQYVEEAKRQFARLTPGKIVITYHGFGGEMPKCMRLTKSLLVEEGGHLSFYEKVDE